MRSVEEVKRPRGVVNTEIRGTRVEDMGKLARGSVLIIYEVFYLFLRHISDLEKRMNGTLVGSANGNVEFPPAADDAFRSWSLWYRMPLLKVFRC